MTIGYTLKSFVDQWGTTWPAAFATLQPPAKLEWITNLTDGSATATVRMAVFSSLAGLTAGQPKLQDLFIPYSDSIPVKMPSGYPVPSTVRDLATEAILVGLYSAFVNAKAGDANYLVLQTFVGATLVAQ